jgi:uncharacterized protein YegP (UPF0339 family)
LRINLVRIEIVMHYVITPAPEERWTWELCTSDGQAVCRGTVNYASQENVLAAIAMIKESVASAPIACEDGSSTETISAL